MRTSFGLTAEAAGQRTITSGLSGGLGAVIRPDELPLVVHALESSGKAQVHSAPKLLVNDNAQGIISAIAEEPYSQVNASDTVATTSFAGYVKAGTEFFVTPHISEGDHLRLEYQITLNSFTGSSADALLPPARDSSMVQSEATVPDGHTIIVGGLRHVVEKETAASVPVLGDIPLLGALFRRVTTVQETNRLYLFVTPTILRDPHFGDLKNISDSDYQKIRPAQEGEEDAPEK